MRQQCLRLRQNDLATALEVTKQPLFVANTNVSLCLEQRTGLCQCFLIALFQISGAQLPIQGAGLLAKLGDRLLGAFFVAGLAAIQKIEPARHLTRQLHMRHLILADRYQTCAVDENVSSLQQRVAEKTVGRQVLVRELRLLIFVARHPLQPRQRCDHRQQRE